RISVESLSGCAWNGCPSQRGIRNYYFHKYSGANPFGFTALDMKAYYMGVTGCRWKETKSSQMTARFNPQSAPNHNALDDARFQGELFALMLAEARNR
ncbi:hypothetical protein ACSEUW_30860, partial [Pseudomonas aeruginosa]